MGILGVGSWFGRHEFLVRRLHSLTGLIPVGGYLAFHLATNASILDGPQTFQSRVDQIHALGPTSLLILEWSFIFLPIIFHSLIGMLIVLRGRRNLVNYPYESNIRYTLQRATGVIAFVFILWHVFHMHGWIRTEWWHETVAGPLGGGKFDPHDASGSVAAAIQASPLVIGIYLLGVLACVYHLANGLWSMGITWGVWTSPKAQQFAKIPCAVFGILLAIVGMGAVLGFARVPVPATPSRQVGESRFEQPRPIEAPSADVSVTDVVSGQRGGSEQRKARD